MNRIFLFLILFGTNEAVNAAADCGGKIDHVSERACLQQDAELSDKELNDTLASLNSRIAIWEQTQEYKSRTLRLLNASVKQFTVYRAEQCDYEASAAAAGNGAGDMRFTCIAELNRLYVGRLQEQLLWFR